MLRKTSQWEQLETIWNSIIDFVIKNIHTMPAKTQAVIKAEEAIENGYYEWKGTIFLFSK